MNDEKVSTYHHCVPSVIVQTIKHGLVGRRMAKGDLAAHATLIVKEQHRTRALDDMKRLRFARVAMGSHVSISVQRDDHFLNVVIGRTVETYPCAPAMTRESLAFQVCDLVSCEEDDFRIQLASNV
jgi:hypothetical protein